MSQLSGAALDELVAAAVVDAYNDDQQLTGLYMMIEQHLAVPFETTVFGVGVAGRRVDLQAEQSWRSVIGAGIGRRSESWTFRCPTLRRRAPSGSPPTRTGLGDE